MRDLTTQFRFRALAILIACGCGSVSGVGTDGAAGTSGQTGSGGSTGAAGSGSAGSTGTGGGRAGNTGTAGTGAGASGGAAGSTGAGGCAANQVWCPGCEPGTGTCYAGGCPGVACPPPGGTGGGGSGGRGGRGGAGGNGGSTGGAGGTISACQAVLALDRSCTTAADCFAGAHTTNCCGQAQYIGFRTSAQAQFQTLEVACDMSYPGCGCPAGQPTTDDASTLRFEDQPGVTCLQGKCTTFVPVCGKPCGAGTTCFSCVSHTSIFAACTTMCTDANQCSDPSLPVCQMGLSGNVSGKYCTAANVACDTK